MAEPRREPRPPPPGPASPSITHTLWGRRAGGALPACRPGGRGAESPEAPTHRRWARRARWSESSGRCSKGPEVPPPWLEIYVVYRCGTAPTGLGAAWGRGEPAARPHRHSFPEGPCGRGVPREGGKWGGAATEDWLSQQARRAHSGVCGLQVTVRQSAARGLPSAVPERNAGSVTLERGVGAPGAGRGGWRCRRWHRQCVGGSECVLVCAAECILRNACRHPLGHGCAGLLGEQPLTPLACLGPAPRPVFVWEAPRGGLCGVTRTQRQVCPRSGRSGGRSGAHTLGRQK